MWNGFEALADIGEDGIGVLLISAEMRVWGISCIISVERTGLKEKKHSTKIPGQRSAGTIVRTQRIREIRLCKGRNKVYNVRVCSWRECKSQINQYLANCWHSEVGGLSLPSRERREEAGL